jgi:diacylglycerol kinase (ATP)
VKDMGSAAVGVALLMAGALWLFAIAERMGVI